MRKPIKKSLIAMYAIISAFLTYIPVVNAQTTDVVNAVGSSIGLALSLIGGIFEVLLKNVTGNAMLAKALIVIFFGVFFYSELKELKPFKNKSGLAGFLAVIISLIVAYWLPDDVIKGIFSGTSPFMGFVIASFILLIARGDSGWSRFARGIAFLALTMAFSLVIGTVLGTIMKTIIAGFVIASIVACFYNFAKIRSGSFEEGEAGAIAGALGKRAAKGVWGGIKNWWNKDKNPPPGGEKKDKNKPNVTPVAGPSPDREAQIKRDIAWLEDIKKVLKTLGEQSSLLNFNIQPRGFNEEKLNVGLRVINNIQNTFEESKVKDSLHRFRYSELDTTLNQFDAVFQDYRMKLINLAAMTPEKRLVELNEKKDAYLSEARIITAILKSMVNEITNLQRILQQQLQQQNK